MGQAVLLDILEEHLEEADFLSQQRRNALRDRVYDLSRLADLEERLLAHLDGLLLAEADAWNLLKPKLTEGDRGEAFAAAFVAMASGEAGYRDDPIKALDQAEGPVLEGITEALRHSSSSEIEQILRPRLGDANPRVRALVLDVLSFRRAALDSKRLELLLLDKDPLVVAAAATTVGRLRIRSFKARLEDLLGSEDSLVRGAAMRAALLVGSGHALAHCRTAVKSKAEEAHDALILIGLSGQAEDARLLVEVLNQPEMARHAVTALGWLDYASTVDALVPLASDPKLSRLAGEAITRITGLDLEKEQLAATASAASKPQEGADDDFAEDPDEGLPWPDSAKLITWWKANASRFNNTTRYRHGHPHSRQVLIDILHHGNLPDRHHAAFELALLEPTSPLLETSAFSDRQRRELAKVAR